MFLVPVAPPTSIRGESKDQRGNPGATRQGEELHPRDGYNEINFLYTGWLFCKIGRGLCFCFFAG